MTFEEFQSNKRWSDNLGHDLQDGHWDERHGKGWIYLDCLYIEQVQDTWPESCRKAGQWYLIGCPDPRDETISDDFTMLEHMLWQWAKDSGYFDPA